MRIRDAVPGDLVGVMTVLDAGHLVAETDTVRDRIEAGDVLVCVDAGPVIGALVLDGTEIVAIAVTPGRRGTGIGTRLVERAAARRDELVAAFDADVKGFWERLGFRVASIGDGRYRGRR